MDDTMNKAYCVFGRKPVIEILMDEKPIDKLMLLKTAQGPEVNEITARARHLDIPIQYVPEEKLDFAVRKFARQREANHQGVVAFLSLLETFSIEDTLQKVEAAGNTPFFVVLDGVGYKVLE